MKNKENFLDYIPICTPGYAWNVNKKGIVVIEVENKGFYNRVAQRFFKRPKVSYIDLDGFGSFVWQQMNGKRSIYDISQLVKAEFGKEAEPLLERITKYFQILYQNHFIGYVKEKE